MEAVTQQHSSSPPSRGSEVLVVYFSAGAPDSVDATEAGFELILNESIAEPMSETGKSESLTVEHQSKKNNLRQFTPYSKNEKKTSTSISPTRTLPLTPLSASSSRQRSPASVTDFEANLWKQQEDQERLGSSHHNTCSLPLQRLVCSKQTGKNNESPVEHEKLTQETDDTTSPRRRPVLRKLICQKYKPNNNPSRDEVDQPRMACDLHQCILPQQSFHSKQDRALPHALLSPKSQGMEVKKDEPIEWNTEQDHPFEDTRQDAIIITPRIVQRLERTDLLRQAAQKESLPEVQHSFESLRLEEQTHRSCARSNKGGSVPSNPQIDSPFHSRMSFNPSRDTQYQAAASTPLAVWKNEVSSSPINFLGGSAYQRRIQRFQKEQGAPSSAEFVFGSGQGDDESSFVEWVEQIEKEKVNVISHTSSQRVGMNLSSNGNKVPAPTVITIPTYSKAMNKSLNTTAETSTYSSIGYGDDHRTRDTASHWSDEEYQLSPLGRKTLRRASFDVSTASISVGSIDSHHFGRSAFVDGTPEAIVAAARASDFDDDDDVWSGNITVKDEEFALAGVYSTPQLPF
ncbi:hypothetical protein FisN_26Lh010 [Fistulifera solaris]|uniref:Uncharacterized protein n=1 Tax=Fistulifera solaris TaxID=1519565 RepID=A0A1Z5KCG5_FISSO|nr:hypothetical protein FisN_26Lh010 [Fistulifera solaris]|eukprot:GAX23953.1 hypothetical protein FisN_26Lh010 [Fistulifera solaris]